MRRDLQDPDEADGFDVVSTMQFEDGRHQDTSQPSRSRHSPPSHGQSPVPASSAAQPEPVARSGTAYGLPLTLVPPPAAGPQHQPPQPQRQPPQPQRQQQPASPGLLWPLLLWLLRDFHLDVWGLPTPEHKVFYVIGWLLFLVAFIALPMMNWMNGLGLFRESGYVYQGSCVIFTVFKDNILSQLTVIRNRRKEEASQEAKTATHRQKGAFQRQLDQLLVQQGRILHVVTNGCLSQQESQLLFPTRGAPAFFRLRDVEETEEELDEEELGAAPSSGFLPPAHSMQLLEEPVLALPPLAPGSGGTRVDCAQRYSYAAPGGLAGRRHDADLGDLGRRNAPHCFGGDADDWLSACGEGPSTLVYRSAAEGGPPLTRGHHRGAQRRSQGRPSSDGVRLIAAAGQVAAAALLVESALAAAAADHWVELEAAGLVALSEDRTVPELAATAAATAPPGPSASAMQLMKAAQVTLASLHTALAPHGSPHTGLAPEPRSLPGAGLAAQGKLPPAPPPEPPPAPRRSLTGAGGRASTEAGRRAIPVSPQQAAAVGPWTAPLSSTAAYLPDAPSAAPLHQQEEALQQLRARLSDRQAALQQLDEEEAAEAQRRTARRAHVEQQHSAAINAASERLLSLGDAEASAARALTLAQPGETAGGAAQGTALPGTSAPAALADAQVLPAAPAPGGRGAGEGEAVDADGSAGGGSTVADPPRPDSAPPVVVEGGPPAEDGRPSSPDKPSLGAATVAAIVAEQQRADALGLEPVVGTPRNSLEGGRERPDGDVGEADS